MHISKQDYIYRIGPNKHICP